MHKVSVHHIDDGARRDPGRALNGTLTRISVRALVRTSTTVAVMSPQDHRITLLGKPGCHLCDDARAVIERVATELGVPWDERDITISEDDQATYGEMIPVTLIDGVQHDFWRVDENRLRAALNA